MAIITGNLWSYDGSFNSFLFQPMVFYNFETLPGLYVAYNGALSADWKADSVDRWTVPLGGVVGRTFDLGGGYGLDVMTGPYWNVAKPEGGADWLLKWGATLLFP